MWPIYKDAPVQKLLISLSVIHTSLYINIYIYLFKEPMQTFVLTDAETNWQTTHHSLSTSLLSTSECL